MAIDFELDSSQYINPGDVCDVTSLISIACFVNPETVGIIAWLAGKDDETDGRSYAFGIDNVDDKLNWQANGTAAAAKSTTSITTGSWQHVGVTHNNDNNVAYFLNGAADGTTTCAGNVANVGADLNIGRRSYATSEGYYDGLIEGMRIYNRILTAGEFALLAAGYRGPLGGELGWWSFNEARTLVVPGALTSNTHYLPDRSASNNVGNPINNPVMVASDCPRFGSWVGAAYAPLILKVLAEGALTFTGTLVKKVIKPLLAGSITPSGTVVKKTKKPLAGSITPSGTVLKKTKKVLAGAITFTGTLWRRFIRVLGILIDLTPTGHVQFGPSDDADDDNVLFDGTPKANVREK